MLVLRLCFGVLVPYGFVFLGGLLGLVIGFIFGGFYFVVFFLPVDFLSFVYF